MPRNGSDIYFIPPGTEGFPDTTIESEKYNNYIHDVETDLNTPRPISAGGTGADDADEALANLGAEKSSQVVINYDTHVFYPGSFYSTIGATNAPVAGHKFVGIAVSSDPPASPPTNLNVVVRAYDQSSTVIPGRIHVREKKAGVWTTAGWSIDGTGVGGPTPPVDPPDNLLWFDSQQGQLYVWYNDGDTKQWVIASPSPDPAQFLLKAGDTMTGTLSLNAPPTADMHAVNKAYVDGGVAGIPGKVSKAGDTMTGPLVVSPKGSLFGNASGAGAATPVTSADANIKLYDYSSVNWAGIGTDNSGNMWFRVGTTGGLIPLVRFETTPNYKVNIQGTLTVTSGLTVTGFASITGAVSVGDTITSTGRMITGSETSGFFANNTNFFGFNGDGTNRKFYFNTAAYLSYSAATHDLSWFANPYNIMTFRYSDVAFVFYGSNAFKPGGGVWADTSDARIKNVEGDYARGLAEIAQLHPVLYTYKGNDTSDAPAHMDKADTGPVVVPYPNSPHKRAADTGTKYAGLIAQEVEAVIPEMVTKGNGYIDGAAVTDLRTLDTTPLIFALVNSIKELKARIEALEGAV